MEKLKQYYSKMAENEIGFEKIYDLDEIEKLKKRMENNNLPDDIYYLKKHDGISFYKILIEDEKDFEYSYKISKAISLNKIASVLRFFQVFFIFAFLIFVFLLFFGIFY